MTTVSNCIPMIDDETIDVACIRLVGPRLQRAVLGELRAADRVLTSWIGGAYGQLDYEWEIVFLDGYVFKGKHTVTRNGNRRHLFSGHVRKAFETLRTAAGGAIPAQYAIDMA